MAQLLLTRKGRCGEYANCFTFLCRCLGYEARLVLATFDHVWTEVNSYRFSFHFGFIAVTHTRTTTTIFDFFFLTIQWQVWSDAQKRWIHIDPSDNVIDAPLMYQHGWKRSVDYIIAYSHEDIQDVTWRYTNNHGETRRNRQRCTEPELLKSIILLREKRQQKCSIGRKKYLKKRNLREIIELMVERQATDNEKKGRSSGSLSWRSSRGEEQCSTDNVSKTNKISANTTEKTNISFLIQFIYSFLYLAQVSSM